MINAIEAGSLRYVGVPEVNEVYHSPLLRLSHQDS
jgi:hypothetical protein